MLQTCIADALSIDRQVSKSPGCSVEAVIDALGYGLLILSSNSEIVTVNSTALSLIKNREWIRITDARLRSSGQNHTHFNEQLVSAIEREVSSTMLLKCPVTENDSLLLTISPIKSDESSGMALGILIDPNAGAYINVEQLILLYSLTNAEADITGHLARGLDYNQIALQRNVSVNTIRSYSKSIFKKLAVKGRAEVVRKVLALQVPLPVSMS